MEQELQEVRDRVSRLKTQQNSPFHPTTSHALMSFNQITHLHIQKWATFLQKGPLGQSVRENTEPQIDSTDYNCHFQPERGRLGTSTEGYGETPHVAPFNFITYFRWWGTLKSRTTSLSRDTLRLWSRI